MAETEPPWDQMATWTRTVLSPACGFHNSPIICSQAKYQQQQEKLQEQEETIARLQKELCKVGMEEQRRVATQNKMFCRFCKRAPKSLLDQQ